MAVRQMMDREHALVALCNGATNIEVVYNFHGAETKFVRHHFDCPHYRDSQKHTERLDDCDRKCKHPDPLYMETTYVGCVVAVGERNGYDDSDFIATVWDEDKGQFKTIVYASTRGWTYPNGAKMDAPRELAEQWRIDARA